MINKRANKYSQDDIENFFNYGFLTVDRTIYLGSIHSDSEGNESGIDPIAAEYLIKGVHILNNVDDKLGIRVNLNSIGGNVFDGLAIYDAIRCSKAPVDIYVYGQAMSMGVVILQAANKRVMMPNSYLMIHEVDIQSPPGNFMDKDIWHRWGKNFNMAMCKIFAERSENNEKYWKEKCSHDYILNASRAVAEGLADEVYCVKNNWINGGKKPAKKPVKKSVRKNRKP